MEWQPETDQHRAKWRGCIKVPYSEKEAANWVQKLRFTDADNEWWFDWCRECQAFHVWRR